MSNYSELREQVLGYLQQSVTLTDPFPGVAGDAGDKAALIDTLILRAANNARHKAELLNDWVYNEGSAAVTVPAGGFVLLTNLTDIESEEVFTGFKNVKEITHEGCPIFGQGRLFGLRRKFLRKSLYTRSRAEIFAGRRLRITPDADEDTELVVYGTRWMNAYDSTSTQTTTMTLVAGENCPFPEYNGLVFYESGTFNEKPLYLSTSNDAIFTDSFGTWSVTTLWPATDEVLATSTTEPIPATPDLVDNFNTPTGGGADISFTVGTSAEPSSNTDWLLEHGFEYMQWATICETNYLLKVFLPRTEGSLPAPTRERDDALESLLRWDTEMVNAQLNIKSR